MKTFRLSGFELSKEIKITPFITTFILAKNGTATYNNRCFAGATGTAAYNLSKVLQVESRIKQCE